MNGKILYGKMRLFSGILRSGSFLLFFVLAAFFAGSPALGAELALPDLQAKAGQDIRVPLMIDQVDRLAGVKLILKYNEDLLTFKGSARTQSTDSMMHVVNDKTPGKLIIVMASARGIAGRDITLLTLFFSVKKGLTGNHEVSIETAEVQLMSDDLRDIPCKTKPGKITILP